MAHTRFMQYELFFAGKIGGVGRVSDDLGRDEDEQVGLGRLLVAGFEQPAEHGDAAEPGDFALIVGLLIVEQAADDRQQGGEGELEGGQQIDVPPVGQLVDCYDVQGVEQSAAQAEQVAPGDGEGPIEGDPSSLMRGVILSFTPTSL